MLARLVLVAFALRALIPIGFMPSADHPGTLIICPDGFPVELLPAAGHGHTASRAHAGHEHTDHSSPERGSAHSDHCSFAAATLAPRMADVLPAAGALPVGPNVHLEYVSPSFGSPRFLIAQPRAPPSHA